MKQTLLAVLITLIGSETASAAKIYRYLHVPSNQVIEPYNFNEDSKTAVYFDYAEGKKKTVNLADLSKETKESRNGVKSGNISLINDERVNFCETFNVFENGMAYVGCQSNTEIQENIGMNRPQQLFGVLDSKDMVGEVKSMDGFSKGEKVTLLKDAGNIKCGSTVRIEAILANGEVVIQKVGINFLDTSSLRLKFGIERVLINDIAKK